MYQIIYKPTQRMERRLPHGPPTGWFRSLSSFVHTYLLGGFSFAVSAINPVLLSFVYLIYCQLKRMIYIHLVTVCPTCTEASRYTQMIHFDRNVVGRSTSQSLFITLINMGADPIINSVNRWHGCHHSNQGGKIQCQ